MTGSREKLSPDLHDRLLSRAQDSHVSLHASSLGTGRDRQALSLPPGYNRGALPIPSYSCSTPETEVGKREPRLTHAPPPRFGIMHACDLTSGQPDCDAVPRVSG